MAAAYATFFGGYVIIKCFIEKIGKLNIELVLKGILFSALSLTVAFVFAKNVEVTWIYVAIGAFLCFAVYDLVLSLAITWFKRRFYKFL